MTQEATRWIPSKIHSPCYSGLWASCHAMQIYANDQRSGLNPEPGEHRLARADFWAHPSRCVPREQGAGQRGRALGTSQPHLAPLRVTSGVPSGVPPPLGARVPSVQRGGSTGDCVGLGGPGRRCRIHRTQVTAVRGRPRSARFRGGGEKSRSLGPAAPAERALREGGPATSLVSGSGSLFESSPLFLPDVAGCTCDLCRTPPFPGDRRGRNEKDWNLNILQDLLCEVDGTGPPKPHKLVRGGAEGCGGGWAAAG